MTGKALFNDKLKRSNSAFRKKCHSVLDTESMKWPFYVDSRQLACRRQACAGMTFEKKFNFKRHKQNC
jgi:hypothetical protein